MEKKLRQIKKRLLIIKSDLNQSTKNQKYYHIKKLIEFHSGNLIRPCVYEFNRIGETKEKHLREELEKLEVEYLLFRVVGAGSYSKE